MWGCGISPRPRSICSRPASKRTIVRRHPIRLLALVPTVAILGAPWFANRIEPRILGLPFLLAWISGWVLGTSIVLWLIDWRERSSLPRE